jgi:hypothetical protein
MIRFFGLRVRGQRKHRSRRSQRVAVEWLEARLPLTAAAVVGLPQFTLRQATTKDSNSVAVDYSIANADITQPLTFDVYRSDRTVFDSSSVLLGETTIDPAVAPQNLTQGTHAGVPLIPGTVLTPNTTLPYIVVVADRNGAVVEDSNSSNTSYFRTFELGVVVHGKESTTSNATPAWETQMASDLKKFDHYDNVIAFNWVKDSSTAAAGLATKAGDTLYNQVVAAAGALDASHAGDVVDLHFIGHSRGAVVVSRSLQDLASQPATALTGSYVKVTLLDAHPSNLADAGLYSAQSGLLGAIAVNGYQNFEASTKDPEVVLPASAGIKAVEVYYQHTPASGFPSNNTEHLLNLWGEGQNDGYLINRSGVAIQWHNLTSVKDPTVGLIGHSEIHAWYQLRVVDAGTTLAQVATPAVASAVSITSKAQTKTNGVPGKTMSDPIVNPRHTRRLSRSAVQDFWAQASDAFE